MLNKNFFSKKFNGKGGEQNMKLLTMLLVLGLSLGLPLIARADVSLGVSASVSSGTSLGPHALIECTGYNYNTTGDPWTQAACIQRGTATTMTFRGKGPTDPLTTRLYDTAGNDIGGAGCFYAANFYIVYLFPDAFGGKGYELRQNTATGTVFTNLDTMNALVRTPVYSRNDKSASTGPIQDDLTAEEEGWNPQLTPSISYLARDVSAANNLILRAKRARIVRAEYGIPPIPGTGQTRPGGWQAIPLTTAASTYTGNVNITLVEWQ